MFSLIFSTTGRAVVAMFIPSALKRLSTVINGITGGKFYQLPPEKENTDRVRSHSGLT